MTIKATWNTRLAARTIPSASTMTEMKILAELAEIGDRDELLCREQEAIRTRRAALLARLPERAWPSRVIGPVCRISHTTVAAIRQKTRDQTAA